MRVQSFNGSEIETYIPDLARLRLNVFRDFPCLYEGSIEYEKDYLKSYPENPQSILIAVFDEHHQMVGASTGIPMSAAPDYVQVPLIQAGYNIDDFYYFAESVLDHAFRGHGFGHRFFELREQVALKNGFKMAAFCAVERPEDHPLRPHDFHSLDEFWIKKGFQIHPEIISESFWRDLGELKDSKKKMSYWLKSF